MVPNTYEVLFDKTETDEHGDEDDRNVTHYPFFDTKTDRGFITGRRLGNGAQTMKAPTDDCTWNGLLPGATRN